MDRYVVFGNPVKQSKSPIIHSAFAQQTGQALEYSALFAETNAFESTAKAFFDGGGKGANITAPFKEEACALADAQSSEAALAGAVNTLAIKPDGSLYGHNTDGTGLIIDILRNHGGTLAGKSLLVLGAGGATRGILQPLIEQKPAQLCIANRTPAKAEVLAALFSAEAVKIDPVLDIQACGFEALAEKRFDWIINATSASLDGNVPAIPEALLTPATWCYDLMYSDAETPFCRWAREQGAAKVMDGLGMLVEQAAESFLLWRGVRPETRAIISQLRQS